MWLRSFLSLFFFGLFNVLTTMDGGVVTDPLAKGNPKDSAFPFNTGSEVSVSKSNLSETEYALSRPGMASQHRLIEQAARACQTACLVWVAHHVLLKQTFFLAGAQHDSGVLNLLDRKHPFVLALQDFFQLHPSAISKTGYWRPSLTTELIVCARGALEADQGVMVWQVGPPSQTLSTTVILIARDEEVQQNWESIQASGFCHNVKGYLYKWPFYVNNHAVVTAVDALYTAGIYDALDSAFDAAVVIDSDERVLLANPSFFSLFKLGSPRLLGLSLSDTLGWQSYCALTKVIFASMRQGNGNDVPMPDRNQVDTQHSGVLRIVLSDHSRATVEYRTKCLHCGQADLLLVRFAHKERSSHALRWQHSSQEHPKSEQLSMSALPVGILQVDSQLNCQFISSELTEITGLSLADCLELGWAKIIHFLDRARVVSRIRHHLLEHTIYEDQIRLHSYLGKVCWVKCRIKPLLSQDGTDGFVAVFMDINDQVRLEKNLRAQSELDALTGLMSRQHFMEQAHHYLSDRRLSQRLAIFYIDLDGFKGVNDKFGHDVGDMMLVEASRRMQLVLRRGDLISRIGGDEFLVLLIDVLGDKVVKQLAAKVIDFLGQPFMLEGHIINGSASLGISTTLGRSHRALNLTHLIKEADQALYTAKRAGRNTYEYGQG